MGFLVDWDGDTRTVTLSGDSDLIEITIGSNTFTANGQSIALEVPAQIIGGSTMLPLRAVLESVGYELDWDGSRQTVLITSAISAAQIFERVTIDQTWHNRRMAIGWGYNAMVDDNGRLWAWGENDRGQLGDGTRIERRRPTYIMSDVVSVHIQGRTTFAITSDGGLWGWGENLGSILSDEWSPPPFDAPTRLMDGVAHVTTASTNVLVLKTDGNLWGWGDAGVLGVEGSWIPISSPARILDNVTYITTSGTITGGGHIFFAIRGDNSLWAWGQNEFGQIGNDTIQSFIRYPVRVLDNVVSVSGGGSQHDSTFAIRGDGSLWAWGGNQNGRLGDGTTVNRFYPIHIMDDVAFVTHNRASTFAIKNDGSLWAWGNNSRGSVGDGTTTASHTPVHIMDNVAIVVSDGRNMPYSFAIRYDGSLWAWGYHGAGLGVGTRQGFFPITSPRQTMENVVGVNAGYNRGFALLSDGSVWAWGVNSNHGVIGDNSIEERLSPVQIFP